MKRKPNFAALNENEKLPVQPKRTTIIGVIVTTITETVTVTVDGEVAQHDWSRVLGTEHAAKRSIVTARSDNVVSSACGLGVP